MEVSQLVLLFCFTFIFFLILSIVLSVTEEDIREITKGECKLSEFLCKVGEAFGIPGAWLNPKQFLKYVIVPLISVFSITYGFLSEAKVFEKRINVVISVLIALTTIYSGAFTFFVAALFATLGMFSVIIFFLLFFLGIYCIFKTLKL